MASQSTSNSTILFTAMNTPKQSFVSNVPLLSFGAGDSKPLTTESGNTNVSSGLIEHLDFTFTKRVDLNSPKLKHACLSGQNFSTFIVQAIRNGAVYVTYTFAQCIFASVSVDSSGGSPVETVKFSCVSVKFTYS